MFDSLTINYYSSRSRFTYFYSGCSLISFMGSSLSTLPLELYFWNKFCVTFPVCDNSVISSIALRILKSSSHDTQRDHHLIPLHVSSLYHPILQHCLSAITRLALFATLSSLLCSRQPLLLLHTWSSFCLEGPFLPSLLS